MTPDDSSFTTVYRQASKIIASLAGTILMFTLLGFGIRHYYPQHKHAVMICVLLGIFFGFAIMIKEAMTEDPLKHR